MEYISGRTIMDIIEYESYEQLEYILERIFHLIKWELANSSIGTLNKEKAFNKIGAVCNSIKYQQENPHMKDLYYIRGILRNRLSYINEHICLDLLKKAYEQKADLEILKSHAKGITNWADWRNDKENFLDYGEDISCR